MGERARVKAKERVMVMKKSLKNQKLSLRRKMVAKEKAKERAKEKAREKERAKEKAKERMMVKLVNQRSQKLSLNNQRRIQMLAKEGKGKGKGKGKAKEKERA